MNNVRNNPTSVPEVSDFKEYLFSEYSNIAQAHFKTIDTISTFFKHYLVIMSIPIALLAFFLRTSMGKDPTKLFSPWLGQSLFVILLVVSLAGLGVLLYIINLRMDAILYARTINAIRKYFYDRIGMDIGVKLQMRVLPQTPYQPAYREIRYFGTVVFSFAIIDTLYFFFALVTVKLSTGNEEILGSSLFKMLPWWLYIVAILFLTLHFFVYCSHTRYRETKYLRSYIIGVDIDGVLNEHREQFCKLLRENTGKELRPEQITVIPVHEDPSLGISRDDEKKVFNDPRYWVEMPVVEIAAENLRKIKNVFKLKVFIFSYRDWPQTQKQDIDKITKKWGEAVSSLSPELQMRISSINPIDRITRWWLQEHEFEYDKLIIEKGNEDVADPQGHFRNRFYICREKKIRFFVEDDLRKAIKLAYICEIVFLFDQPYNRYTTELPSNIIRVKSWDEIYKEVRRLS